MLSFIELSNKGLPEQHASKLNLAIFNYWTREAKKSQEIHAFSKLPNFVKLLASSSIIKLFTDQTISLSNI